MRRPRDGVFPTLLKAMYQATKRIGATHWLAGMEQSLHYLLTQQGLPLRLIGPEGDYFGLVAPYAMDLEAFDQVIVSGRFPDLDALVVGLEPEFLPQAEKARPRRFPVSGPASVTDHLKSAADGIQEVQGPVFGPETEARLLNEFRRAATGVPAYRRCSKNTTSASTR